MIRQLIVLGRGENAEKQAENNGKMVARVAISKVAGMASAKSSSTGRLVRMEVPQSPDRKFLT